MAKSTSEDANARFLFLPYCSDKKASTSGPGLVSQQQHAAREYHRKAKLQRAKVASKAPNDHKKVKRTRGPIVSNNSGDHSVRVGQRCLAVLPPPKSLLGSGRIDPFDAYCEEQPALNVHEMLDHALTHQWSVFRYARDETGLNELKGDVMKCVMTTPVSWYAVVYAGATHHAFCHRKDYSPKFTELLRLTYKTKAIRWMREEISKSAGFASDDVLLGMITLAAHGPGDVPKPPDLKRCWTTSALSTAHNLDFFSVIDTAWEHMNALILLVARQGGLHTVKLKAAAIAIQLRYIFIEQFSDWVFVASSSSQRRSVSTPSQAVKVAVTLIVDFDQWQRKTADPPDYVHVQFTRWCVLHDLLSLPDVPNRTQDEDDCLIYQMIRFGAFAYILFTLVSVPHAGALPYTIADKLRVVLDACVAKKDAGQEGPCVKQPGLFIWTVVLGGMCAFAASDTSVSTSQELDSPLSSTSTLLEKYVGYTSYMSVKADVHAWPLVVSLLGRHLWLEVECNELGETFWRYACDAGYYSC